MLTPAQQELVENNLRLVRWVIKRFRYHGKADFEDLVSEGTLGLTQAAERFDPSRGVQFSTYAAYWIRKAIMDLLHSQSLIHVAGHVRRLRKQSQLTPRQQKLVQASSRALAPVVSLDFEPLAPREPGLDDPIPLDCLPQRERKVIELRYFEGLTFEAIGQRFGFTRERARQIEVGALRKLRKIVCVG